MSLARVTTFALDGVESRPVWVETDIRTGLPAFTVVGLADKAVREARERVRAAIVNSGFEFPNKRITVNLAPAYLHKVGPSFDLPLAVAVLVAAGQVPAGALEGCAVAGELSLAGRVRPIRGVLAIAEGTRRRGIGRLFVPSERAREAALVEGIEVCGVRSLQEIVDVLHGRSGPAPVPPPAESDDAETPLDLPDFSDVRGHNVLIGAVEVAAAGGHNLYMHGPPGTGKTMIARRIGSILPPLTPDEAIGVTRIHSVAGLHGGSGLVEQRPFRAPHHTISPSGLVGGGSSPMPGEVTLAHHGVLFLDELSEFPRSSLEALRQPLEDGHVAIVRGQRLVVYPSSCMLVAAANPCPCGRGEPSCHCTAADLSRHQRRLSGPLLDRIDVTLLVDRPTAAALETQTAPPSAEVRARVVAARERQVRRFAGTEVTTNAQMTPRMLRELTGATSSAIRMLYALHDRERLSARGHARVLRVARTVADLAASDSVHSDHVSAAAHLRTDAAAGAGVSPLEACDRCLRRTDLVAALGGTIDVQWRTRGARSEVLGLPDEVLVELTPDDGPRVRFEAFDPAAARDRIAQAGLVAVCRCDDDYPERLRDLHDPPAVLHIAGDPGALQDADCAAMVGARKASPYGLEVARGLGRALSSAGVLVISGMALGVDSAAHTGALEGAARTVAVLAGGADVPYPSSKRVLYRRILERGCAVSELPPGFTAFRWCFPARNRLIAGLAGITVVVEAAERSGSLITADFAADLGRPVAAVPGQVTSRLSGGTHALLKAGAALVADGTDVLDLLFEAGGGATRSRSPAEPAVPLEPHLRDLLEAVEQGGGSLASVATTQAEAQAAIQGLTQLELRGLVRREFGGRYVRCL